MPAFSELTELDGFFFREGVLFAAMGAALMLRALLPVLAYHGVNVKWHSRGLPHGFWASIFEAVAAFGLLLNLGLFVLLGSFFDGQLSWYMPVFWPLFAIGSASFIAYIPARVLHEDEYARRYMQFATAGMEY